MKGMVAIGAGFVVALAWTTAAAMAAGLTGLVGLLVAAAWFGLLVALVGMVVALSGNAEPQRRPAAASPGAPAPYVHTWWSPAIAYQSPPACPVPAGWAVARPTNAASAGGWPAPAGLVAAPPWAVAAPVRRQRRHPSAVGGRAMRHGAW